MADRESALAILGAAIGDAGLLLVFAGFLLIKADSYQTKRGDKFRWIAKAALIPLLAAIACTWIAVDAAQGGSWQGAYLYCSFKIVLAVSAVYAIIAVLMS
jgi:hypothetical protein